MKNISNNGEKRIRTLFTTLNAQCNTPHIWFTWVTFVKVKI
jgi:hypothetical protein